MQEDIMKIINKIFLHVFLMSCISCFFSLKQISAQEKNIYTQDSVWKSQQEYLDRRYIPEDEYDAFHVLEELSNEEGLMKFKQAPEDSIKGRLHYGLGGWMMQNWHLYSGSRLSYYLNRKGLTFPDDMVEYLIITFHRYLNKEEIRSQELIDSLNALRKEAYREMMEEKLKTGTPLDTLIYNEKTGEFKEKE